MGGGGGGGGLIPVDMSRFFEFLHIIIFTAFHVEDASPLF